MSKRSNDVDASTIGGVTAEKSQRITDPQEDQDWRLGKGVLKRYSWMYENSHLSDCTFKVDNGKEPQQIFQCHKLILAGASPVFERMFFGPLKETGEITVTDISPTVFQRMLKYLYTEDLPSISLPETQELYVAADKYMVVHLLECCRVKILSLLNPETAVPIFEFANNYGFTTLIAKAKRVMRMNTKGVISCKTFLKAEPDTIKVLLEEEDLNLTSEKILWDAIILWALSQCPQNEGMDVKPLNENKQLREVLEPILPHFRFLSMTHKEFAEGPASSSVLTNEECYAILMHKSSLQISTTFPQDLSFSKKKHCSPIFYCVRETDKSISFFLRKPLKISGFSLYNIPEELDSKQMMLLQVISKGNNSTYRIRFCIFGGLGRISNFGVDHVYLQANERVTFILRFVTHKNFKVEEKANVIFSQLCAFNATKLFHSIWT